MNIVFSRRTSVNCHDHGKHCSLSRLTIQMHESIYILKYCKVRFHSSHRFD